MKTLRPAFNATPEHRRPHGYPVPADALQSVFARVEALLFPGLSDPGRIRATPKLTFNMKLENNFFTNLSFGDNYDSHPPPNSKGNEFGISSGVGRTV